MLTKQMAQATLNDMPSPLLHKRLSELSLSELMELRGSIDIIFRYYVAILQGGRRTVVIARVSPASSGGL